MGHVEDRWTTPGPGGKRIRTARWGSGRRWRARWTDPDGRERSKSYVNKDEALAEMARVDVDLRAGTYIDAAAGRETFKAVAERWLRNQVHHRPSTRAQAESRLRLHVYPVIGATPVGRIRRSDVQALFTGLAEGPLAPATVSVIYKYVAAVFASAVEDRLIPSTPCRRIQRPEVPRTRVKPRSVEEVKAIAAAMTAHLRGMVWLAAGSGLRPAELRGLTIDRLEPPLHLVGDILPSQVTLRVDRQLAAVRRGGHPVWGPGKTPAADRLVVIGEPTIGHLVEHLRAHPPGVHGLVFTSQTGRPLTRGLLADAWTRATAGLANPPRTGWHELRHHHASLLIGDGLSPRAVADRLGHADPAETLRTYAHLWESDHERVLAAIRGAYGP